MRLLSQDEDQLDLRVTFDEFILLRDLLDEHCTGDAADISLYDAEALLRFMNTTLERLDMLPPSD
jgi:hypothetical protein